MWTLKCNLQGFEHCSTEDVGKKTCATKHRICCKQIARFRAPRISCCCVIESHKVSGSSPPVLSCPFFPMRNSELTAVSHRQPIVHALYEIRGSKKHTPVTLNGLYHLSTPPSPRSYCNPRHLAKPTSSVIADLSSQLASNLNKKQDASSFNQPPGGPGMSSMGLGDLVN